jgi:hypothetical protein
VSSVAVVWQSAVLTKLIVCSSVPGCPTLELPYVGT